MSTDPLIMHICRLVDLRTDLQQRPLDEGGQVKRDLELAAVQAELESAVLQLLKREEDAHA